MAGPTPSRGGSALRGIARALLPMALLSPLRKLMRPGGRGAPSGPAPLPAPGSGNRLAGTVEELRRLVALLRGLGPGDRVVVPTAEPVHLELLLGLVPHLGLDRPSPAALHLGLADGTRLPTGKGEVDAATLRLRLATGCPFRTLTLHASDGARRCWEALLGLPVRAEPLPGPDEGAAPASLRLDAFGPVALLVSAFWGRVGSSAIFEAQTRHLIERGFLVTRLLVEHWPHVEPGRSARNTAFLSENFEAVRPHAFILAERRDTAAHLARLLATREFRSASVVTRVGRMLADPVVADPASLAWAGRQAAVALVNHLPHLILTEAVTRAPVILATHDIYTELIRVHGVPDFVPHRRIDFEACRRDETAAWARVAVCVNLSPEDQAAIGRVARHAVLARPYALRHAPSGRSWTEVVSANGLPAAFLEAEGCDILLWGGWHQVNVDAVHWFIEAVRPLHPALLAARVIVAGRVAQGLDPARLAVPGVLVAGFVDRIEDLMAHARLLVIADGGGTGVSIKAMEALASGAPFASTGHGMRGLDLGGTGFAPAADAASLARDVVALLGSGEARRDRAATGAAIYELNFSATAHARAMDAALAHARPEPKEAHRLG
jgi:hypothetical protein